MYYRLALKNLKSRKSRTALTAAGIAIGICALVLMLALSEGLKAAAFRQTGGESVLTELTVQTKSRPGSLLKLIPLDENNKITPQVLEKIKSLPHVSAVYPEMIYGNISSLQVNWLGEGLQTDTMVFGVPYDFIAGDYNGTSESWDNAKSPYPALVSKKIIDIYNFTVAPASGLPVLGEKDLNSIDVSILPDVSTFFPRQSETKNAVPARIVGFSDRTSLVGITIPLKTVLEMNRQRDSAYKESYLRLHLRIDKAENVESVRQKINGLGFDAVSPLEEVKAISENFLVVEMGLTSIGLIILLVAGLMIASTFLSAVSERKHDIGLYRALGATRSDIKKIFLAEASVIGLLGGICGIVAGIAGGLLLNKSILDSLPEISFKPGTLFIYDPLTMVFVLAFGVLLSTIFAYLPALAAARLNPLEALSQE